MEDQEAPEQSSSLLPPSQPDSQKPCRYCRKDIHIDAKVCQHCRYHQKRYVQYYPNIQSVGLLLTFVALGISSCHLMEARNQRISASEAKTEAIRAKESATESVRRVEAVAVQVQATERKIEGLLTQAQTIEQHLLEIEERIILRIWVNTLPDGSELLNPITGAQPKIGQQRIWVGPLDKSVPPFQLKPGSHWEWTWTCDDNNLQKLTRSIESQPYVPYATVARADCLKKQGDPSWKEDAGRAKVLLEKMRALQPHPKEIDDFYGICLSLLQAS
jgi:hypothetical protein